MGKLFLQINSSLDGFIEDPTGEIDWLFADDEFEEFLNDTLRSIDSMVFGRVAYEKLAEYWPTAASNPEASKIHIEAAQLMNELPKYVVSNSLERTEWQNSRIVRGDVARAIRALKAQADKDIALFAGARVASSFTRLGLIDEYRIIVNPILLGAGTRLFEGGHEETRLELLETRRFGSALVLSYAIAGQRPGEYQRVAKAVMAR
jgi:dihydrofolate reductase